MKPISTRIKVVCPQCGDDLSSWTRGDYWNSADNQPLSHDCQLAVADDGTSQLQLLQTELMPGKEIAEGDDMGVGQVWESTTRYTVLTYPATVGDLDRVTRN